MRSLGVALLALAASCGRVGFDTHDAGRDASGDAALATPVLVGSATSDTTMSPVTVPVTIGQGDLVIVAALAGNAQITSISDGAPGNAYVSAGVRQVGAAGQEVEIWYAADSQPVTGAMTITFSSTSGAEVWVAEYSGIATSSPRGAVAGASGTTNGVAPGAAITTTQPHELVFTILGMGSGAGVTAIESGNPFVAFTALEGDDAAYDIAATPGTYAATWTIAANNAFETSTVSFLPARL